MLKLFLNTAFCAVLSVFLFNPVHAIEMKDSGFQVYPVFPPDQLDDKASFFHAPFVPGETKTFRVALENFSDAKKTILVQSNNALSSPLVNIDYQQESESFYSHFLDPAFSLKNQLVVDKEITLAPMEKREITFKVTTPSSVTEGEILGAISFQQKEIAPPKSTKKNEMSVQVQRKYTIAILLETGKPSAHQFLIKDATVDVNTGEPIVYAHIENHSADIVKGLSLTYKVRKLDNPKILMEKTIAATTFSPKTSMKLPILWNNNEFKPGDYVIDFKLNEENGTLLSEERKNITINKNQVNQLINEAKNTQKDNIIVVEKPLSLWMIFSIVIVLILLVVNIFLLYRKNKQKKQSN